MTTVLLIDDDSDATFLLGTYFARRGFAVSEAHTLEDAKKARQ